jgi:hypothetical protein
MASIYGFSLPDGFQAGASFMLSSQPWRHESQDSNGARVVIKAGQARLHVSLSQISPGASTEDLSRYLFASSSKISRLIGGAATVKLSHP